MGGGEVVACWATRRLHVGRIPTTDDGRSALGRKTGRREGATLQIPSVPPVCCQMFFSLRGDKGRSRKSTAPSLMPSITSLGAPLSDMSTSGTVFAACTNAACSGLFCCMHLTSAKRTSIACSGFDTYAAASATQVTATTE